MSSYRETLVQDYRAIRDRLWRSPAPEPELELAPEPEPEPEPLPAAPPPFAWPERPSALAIARFTADQMGVSFELLMSHRRIVSVVRARQLSVYLCRRILPPVMATYPRLGRAFGGFDHTTIMFACRRTEWRIAHDPDFAARAQDIEQAIRNAYPTESDNGNEHNDDRADESAA